MSGGNHGKVLPLLCMSEWSVILLVGFLLFVNCIIPACEANEMMVMWQIMFPSSWEEKSALYCYYSVPSHGFVQVIMSCGAGALALDYHVGFNLLVPILTGI